MGNFAKGLGLGLLLGYAGIATIGFIGVSILYYETSVNVKNTYIRKNRYDAYKYPYDSFFKNMKDRKED